MAKPFGLNYGSEIPLPDMAMYSITFFFKFMLKLIFYFGACGRLVAGIVVVISWNVGLRERKVTFVVQHERRPAVVLRHPPALQFHGHYLLVRVLGRPSLLPTDDVLHLEGSVNQDMGAVIFSDGVTQTPPRLVLVVEQLFHRFLLLLRHYLRRTATTDLKLYGQGCQDPVNCTHGHVFVSKVVYRKLFCVS